MSTTPTPPNGMVSNTELILRKILGEDVTPLPPNSRVEFYLTQVEEYIERLATGATRPIGETTTPLTDGATTNPITIDGESYTAQINDLVFYQNKEFLFTVNGWREVGDITNLNADMIDDTNTTNKFATTAQLQQIEENKNNILSNQNDIDTLYKYSGGKNKFNINTSTIDAINASYILNPDGTLSVSKPSSFGQVIMTQTFLGKTGTYIITGCPSGGSVVTYELLIQLGDTVLGRDYGTGATVSLTNGTEYLFKVVGRDNYTMSNMLFKPMISLEGGKYQQYAPSNAELYSTIGNINSVLEEVL